MINLLSAYQRYRDSGDVNGAPFDLVFLGDGPQRSLIEQQVATLGLAGHVHFCGFLQYATVPGVLALAEALILPSLSDQWGLAVNEAMATSTPVLVSDRCGAAPDLVIEGQTGFTFDPETQDDIARALVQFTNLSCDTRSEMGKAAQDHVQAFSPQKFAESAVELAILGQGQPKRSRWGAAVLQVIATLRGLS